MEPTPASSSAPSDHKPLSAGDGARAQNGDDQAVRRHGLVRPSADTEAASTHGGAGDDTNDPVMDEASPQPVSGEARSKSDGDDTSAAGAPSPPDQAMPPSPLAKHRHWRWWLGGGVAAFLAVLGGIAGYGWLTAYADGPSEARTIVIVPRGGLVHVTQALHQAGIIDSPLLFRATVEITRWQGAGTLHAAEFEFPAHASVMTVLHILRTARPVQHTITLPEGITAFRVAEILSRDPVLTGDTPVPPEGSLLPQTYAFERGATRQQIVERATEASRHWLEKAWQGRDRSIGLTSPEQAVILASIVERETARPQERPHVAAVFLNRLKHGMRLQADSTLVYAASGGSGQLERSLSHADLAFDEPYNTYRIHGLPPGPIGNPGQAALEAVLHPLHSDDLYFVADGNGGHNFARDLGQHEANVRKWRDGKKSR
ncbi:putative membrane associated protein [Granulibacter bethesdensis]|uniref:endolytic transglycosylase MltG n=1 Tax=Granulibacter bethesdensis TaxID=364410 RepID=UPI000909804A|nr:endolytic transglycosylase MltG [Granulibacter bethesdensis]APH58043.1 putative membrane associated protein [Granulibacter bethesdensis]